MTCLILSPHCDDAPLSVVGAILSGSLGPRPHVEVLFSISQFTIVRRRVDVREITALRQSEECRAAAVADYEVSFRGLEEPAVRAQHPPGNSVPFLDICDLRRIESEDPAWPDLLATVEQLCRKPLTAILCPLGCGSHIDHRMVKAALIACAHRYPNLPVGFYEDLPYSYSCSDAEIEALIPAGLRERVHPQLLGDNLSRKLDLLKCYPSQLDEEDIEHVTAYWARRGGGERIWLPSSAPSGSKDPQSA